MSPLDHAIEDVEKAPSENNDDNSTHSSSDEDNAEQIRVAFKLSSECQDRSLEVPSQPIAVPADISRKGLDAVINHLLDRRPRSEDEDDDQGEDDNDDEKLQAIPFDFIVGKGGKRLLRTNLEREARRCALSLEEAIPITYFPAQEKPEQSGQSEPLPDWIGTMSFVKKKNKSLLCTGCYDGSVHLFRPENEQASSQAVTLHSVAVNSQAHGGPIKCLDTALDEKNDAVWIASGSMDHTLRIQHLDHDDHLKTFALCKAGHGAAIGSLDLWVTSNKQGRRLASGDWDGTLCIWDFSNQDALDEDENQQPTKKKKTETSLSKSLSSKEKVSDSILKPYISIRAHASQVSGVSWGNFEKINDSTSNKLITASWDHSIKVWDVEQQDCLLTLNGSRVITCFDTSYHTANIVASGHPDCTVRLWDTRVNHNKDNYHNSSSDVMQQISDNTFRPSHKAWVSSVQWSRHNAYHLASTSHDGTIKLWDIRSTIPLHTVKAFPKVIQEKDTKRRPKVEKGLSLAYGEVGTTNGLLFAGGTDSIVKQFRFNKNNMQSSSS